METQTRFTVRVTTALGRIAAGSLLLTLALASQDVSGAEARSAHKVQLLTSAPERCLSIPAGQGLSFVLDMNDVESMAAQGPARWSNEAERMLLVRSQQARALLAIPSEQKDSIGCDTQENPGDGAYALLNLVSLGRGRVWDANSKAFLSEVERLDYNADCRKGGFGKYAFQKPGGGAFFAIMACSQHGLSAAPKAWVPGSN